VPLSINPAAQQCRGAADQPGARFSPSARGDLVVTAPVVFGRLHVLPVVVEFLRAYPEVNVRLVLGDRMGAYR